MSTDESMLGIDKLLFWFSRQIVVISLYSCTALHLAAFEGHTRIIEILCAFGACLEIVDMFNDTPLIRAVQADNVEAVRLLLALNADATRIVLDGRFAIRTNCKEMRQLLLEHSKKSVRNFLFHRMNDVFLSMVSDLIPIGVRKRTDTSQNDESNTQ